MNSWKEFISSAALFFLSTSPPIFISHSVISNSLLHFTLRPKIHTLTRAFNVRPFYSKYIMPSTRSGKTTAFVGAASKVDFTVFAYEPSKQSDDTRYLNQPKTRPKANKNSPKSSSVESETSHYDNVSKTSSTNATTPSPARGSKSSKSKTPKQTLTKKKIKEEEETNLKTPTKKKRSSPSSKTETPQSKQQTQTKNEIKEEETNLKTPTKKKRSTSSPQSKSKTPRSASPRKRPRIEPGSLKPPPKWESIYSLVEELRADKTAPLDSDGGGSLPEKHRGEVVFRYQVLTALMLSSQTKDATVGEAMRAMQSRGLDVQTIHDMDAEELNGYINKVGFHNNKTKYMKQTADILIKDYNGDIPSTAIEMITLPGVGPKMAYIVESIVFGTASGIGVDTHMHRMFNDLKWVSSKNPEQTREQLEGWLPKEKWGEINELFVGFGQESQQQKEKSLKKAIACSRPVDALKLLEKVGMDVKKEAKKYGLLMEIDEIRK